MRKPQIFWKNGFSLAGNSEEALFPGKAVVESVLVGVETAFSS